MVWLKIGFVKDIVNKYNKLNMRKVHLEHTFDILPHEHIESKVNEYTLFMKEYNDSNKYRLIFSFNPICSNVLFNAITEITQNEGSDNCILYNKAATSLTITDEKLKEYLKYTKRIDNNNVTSALTKENLIMDTGYSHPEVGNFEYHCGYDIFDNHILRSKEFVVVNMINPSINQESQRMNFNTLSDYLRDNLGVIKEDKNLIMYNDEPNNNKSRIKKHLYTTDTVYSYTTSINENLIEDNGWLGFINKGNLNIANFNNITINKVINNMDIGGFVDMYPDRSLYSILPKYNKHRDRYENNWEFCLTYPFENFYDNELVKKHGYNGVECIFKLDGTLQIGNGPNTKIITLRTFVEHGLKTGDKFKLAYFYENTNGTLKSSGETVGTCTVVGTGSNLYEKKQYIKIRVNDIQNLVSKIYEDVEGKADENGVFAVERDYFTDNNIKFRFCKVIGNTKSKYYIRKFKILTKKNGSRYNYTLNKLAFAKNIYEDRVGEIIFDDVIDISGIKNNLGLPLTELFISVFKTNHGYKEWYGTKFNGGSENVEFSHCFGELTSGFDMPSDEECIDYNVHRLHNINTKIYGIQLSGEPLERDICLKNNIDTFYGDLIEFNEKTLNETILEDVYYRFNTAQREVNDSSYGTLYYHEIQSDDYDFNGKVFLETKNIAKNNDSSQSDVPINLNPEGYYYKAHHRIPLKEYMPRVYWGSDILVKVVSSLKSATYTIGRKISYMKFNEVMYEYEIICDKSYNMIVHDKIYLVNKNDVNDVVYGMITEFNNNKYKVVINKDITFSEYKFFKVNPIKPENAYTIPDGSGNYVWRIEKGFNDIDSDSELYNRPFTNGTHYLHKDINLYLKRQDPHGIYGLSFNSDMPLFKTNFNILGNEKEVNNKEYVENITQKQC